MVGGQTRQALWARETGRRDYDRPTSRFMGQTVCWKKSVGDADGPCDGVVEVVDAKVGLVKDVPPGVALCLEHGFLSDDEVELAKLITPEDEQRWQIGKSTHVAEMFADLAHEQKMVDREDGKWGGC